MSAPTSIEGNKSRASLLSASLANASSLVVLQLGSRLITFALNQALVRLAPPEVFGTAAVQFELLLSTILFLSREGVRNALLRAKDTATAGDGETKTSPLVSNISLLPIYLGVPVAAITSVAYRTWSPPETRAQPYFDLSVALYVIGAGFILLSEPLHIRAVNELRSGIRMRAEGTAVVVKSVATLLVIGMGGARWCLAAFAIGQVASGLALLLVYMWEYRNSSPVLPIIPQRTEDKLHDNVRTRYFDEHLLRLSAAMLGQSVVKHFLTEGDRLIVSRISPLEDQGGYAVASNYGSLVARVIFLPMEETSRLFFSKLLSTGEQVPPTAQNGNLQDETASKTQSLRTASEVLHTLLLFDSHLALLFITFGPPYVPTLLSFLLPARYLATSAPRVLVAYCSYLPVMAVNGIVEAFFASTAEQKDLRRQSWWMLGFSIIFIFASFGFAKGLGWGETGLVWANIVNLACRSVYCWVYIRRYFREKGDAGLASIRQALPPPLVISAFVVAGAVVRVSEQRMEPSVRGRMEFIGIGAASAIACMAVCLGSERGAIARLRSIVKRQ